ncbi:MAG: hypothetical protein GY770_30110 [Aestuariibacter sp.]|nr:hypothetical protein [Aestuariibacter sp.]
MPFTPLHMGPGLIVKACMQGTFSLMVFGWSQILIDIQPLVVLLSGKGELHGFSHTYIGATIVAVVSALTGKYLGEIGLRVLRMENYNPIGWKVAFISAFIGGYSHVFIDGIMHSDMRPLAPFSQQGVFLGIVNIDTLHILCVLSAVIGGAGFYFVERIRNNA